MLQEQSRERSVLGTLVFDRRATDDWPRRGGVHARRLERGSISGARGSVARQGNKLPEGSRERDVCQEIAQGYDDLADLIEQPSKAEPA